MPTLHLPLRRPIAAAAALLLLASAAAEASYLDYGDALSKSILFFEGQRSGFLPQDQRLAWRGNSGLGDGSTYNADLTGGYYDAGDNVKFGFPMAFTTTLLAWSVVEFGDLMPPPEMRNALVAIRWATDYLLKTVSQPNRIFVQTHQRFAACLHTQGPLVAVTGWTTLYIPINAHVWPASFASSLTRVGYVLTILPHICFKGILCFFFNNRECVKHKSLVDSTWAVEHYLSPSKVGDPNIDHNCWERPEDMDTARTVSAVDAPNPASDVAGETAAAFAASSMAFRSSDPGYSDTLLKNAVKTFEFADSYRGAYSDNSDIRDHVCPFYCDFDGYQDELLWGAAWLRRATQDESYLNYIQNNGKTLGADENINEFGWDNKHAGLNVLVSKEFLQGNVYSLQSYKSSADSFMCTLIPDSSSTHIQYTPGGLIYKPGGSNLQHATSIAFLLLIYANYLSATSQSVNCGSVSVGAATLRQQAKRQADYILGENPKGISYMVGYSAYYPQRIHHRASSLPSIKDHPQFIACKEGSIYFNSSDPNPNVLIGALVGGPGEDDEYEDNRVDFRKSEPTTYINAPFVGVLAYLNSNPNPS